MRAIILNAGIGKRLRPLTEKTHKCLIDVSGKTILGHQLEILKNCGVDQTIIVTGAKNREIDNFIESNDNGMDIRTVFNPFYEITENIVSLWFARDCIDGPVVVMMGDLIFEQSIMTDIINDNNLCTLAVQKKNIYDKDDMKVQIEKEQVLRISKNLDAPNAEYLQMSYYNSEGAVRLRKVIDDIIADQRFYGWYPEVIQDIINDGMDVCPVFCDGKKWIEIDCKEHLEDARKLEF